MTICKILEGILPKESVRGAPPPDKKLLEYHFVFACIWAFGGCMMVDKVGLQGWKRRGANTPPSKLVATAFGDKGGPCIVHPLP
jgi:hypothetical protein